MSDAIPGIRYEFMPLSGGGRMRYAIMEPKGTPKGTFLVAQGRREFIEKKYFEIGRDLLERGYKMIFFDWRGQGQSTRYFSGERSQYDHAQDFQIFVDDLDKIYRDVVRPQQGGDLYVFAHSIGGLITTQWLTEKSPAVKAAIMTAPALAIGVPWFSYPVSHFIVTRGRNEKYAVGQNDYGPRDRAFRHNVLSHDPERFTIIESYFDKYPEYKVGGVTWGWLEAALKAMRELRHAGYMEKIKIPVLGLFGSKDIVTPAAKTIALFRRMPNAEAHIITNALHDIMNEADIYRDEAWREIDGFLSRMSRG